MSTYCKFSELVRRFQLHGQLQDAYRFAIDAVDEAYVNASNIAARHKIAPRTCANKGEVLTRQSREINRRADAIAEDILSRSTHGKRPACQPESPEDDIPF